jgi:formylglycine-generating enzyme required for sulfatase activity
MRRALRDFSDHVRDADIAVVFFAGHGMEMNGTNYLIPTDAVLERDVDLADEAITLDRVNLMLEPAKRLRLVILDACRDNPFTRSIRRTLPGRSIGRGLAPVEVTTTDTLIAYAAKAGSTATDGAGTNSPYTTALVKHLTTPGLDVRLALGRVRDEVVRTTTPRQEPFVYGSLGGAEVPLVAAPRSSTVTPPVPPTTAPPAIQSAAAEAWPVARDSGSVAVLEAFIRRFGDTFFSDLARQKLDEVKQAEAERLRLAALEQQKRTAEAAAEAQRKAEEEARRRDLVAALVPGSGRSARDCAECPEMVVVPAGRFTMGSPAGEVGRDTDERPQRVVTIAQPFAVGKFEVTFAEWDAYVAKATSIGGTKPHSPNDLGWGRGRRPVINVSWDDAKGYVAWLSRVTGKTYRLLSEAEWEYAARAGTTTPFHTGPTINTNQANYDGNVTYGNGRKGSDRQWTVEVGSLNTPNAFGLHDMHGNVWEWVEDCYVHTYQGLPTDGSPAPDRLECSRVVRGGSWGSSPYRLRSANRDGSATVNRLYYNGFRVARSVAR